MIGEEEFLQEFYGKDDIKLTEKSCATCNFYMTPSYCDADPVCKGRSKWVKTEITDKEQAVEYILSLELEKGNKILQTREVIEAMLQAYIDGLNKGRQKWHDLRKDKKDKPVEDCEVALRCYNCRTKKIIRDIGFYRKEEDIFYHYKSDKIIAWCELPKFEE